MLVRKTKKAITMGKRILLKEGWFFCFFLSERVGQTEQQPFILGLDESELGRHYHLLFQKNWLMYQPDILQSIVQGK